MSIELRLRPRLEPCLWAARILRIAVIPLALLCHDAAAVPVEVPGTEAPAFTLQQARAGSAQYQAHCASCHGAHLQGVAAPSLAGDDFMHRWGDGKRSVGDLYALIRNRMPKQAPGSLSQPTYLELVSYVLIENGFPPGSSALAPGPAMDTKLSAAAAAHDPAAVLAQLEPRPASFPGPATVYGTASTNRPDEAELLANSDADWLMYNKSYSGQRYSGLRQINVGNAARLRPVCVFQTGEIGSFENAPVVYDGVMYITTAWGTYAVGANDCKLEWQSHYDGSTSAPMKLTRGVALYRGKVFRTTPNGHLLALDAQTGRLLWDVWMTDPERGYWLSGAPIAFGGKVFMGEAGADWGADGHVMAFDADTGRHVWTFDIIPTGSELGADTWGKGAAHGGGSMWSTFALQPIAGGALLFASTGNPAPDFNSAARPGDNLFTNSVVALNASTGKVVWYVQQVPHDTHDWDTAAAPILYATPDGGRYMAVVNKGGWLYIYDRRTHRLLRKSEITSHLNVDTPVSSKPIRVCPGNIGGALWNGPTYSPAAGIMVTNAIDWCGEETLHPQPFVAASADFDGSFSFDPMTKARGWIRAFDATGRPLWQRRMPSPMVAGLTATAGGVILTGSTGGDFLVLDVRSGSTLYRFQTGGSVAGAPSTYRIGDTQYVAVPSSGGPSWTPWGAVGAGAVFVFALR